MIPRVIHYCWFGRGRKPRLAERCIASWRRHLPDYELREWNEDNFNLDSYPYTREAYDRGKYAFVTDVVRLYALYHEGGIYMDTDVEVLRPLDEFLDREAFTGFETPEKVPTGIMASEPHGAWAKQLLDYYSGRHFVAPDGSTDTTTNVTVITRMMLDHGLRLDGTLQHLPGLVTIYPRDFFCPLAWGATDTHFSANTATIHHFAGSWLPPFERFRRRHPRLYSLLHRLRHPLTATNPHK